MRGHTPLFLFRILLLAFCVHLSTSSQAMQSPEEWPEHWFEIGTVQEWMDLDAVFYRSSVQRAWKTEGKEISNQPTLYRRTFRFGAGLPAVDLSSWLELSPEDQARRIDLAAEELKIVTRFLDRMRGWARDFQSSSISSWGRKNSVDVLPQCMESLNTAVQLDPSNPLTWHLLGYFSTCVGDVKRARGAFAGADNALAQLPADALPQVRRRLALDQAWLHRNLGGFDRARDNLKVAENLGTHDLETTLLRGLIAAQAGDESEARSLAGDLRTIRIPRHNSYSTMNPDHWNKKASDFAKSWIMALVWINVGNLEMAQLSFKQFSFHDRYPFAHHFWNDAGGIYMRTGRQDIAPSAWYLAHQWVPYQPFFLHRRYGWENRALTGIDGVTLDYAGFNQFYMVGDRLSFACRYVNAMETAASDEDRMLLGVTAVEQLEICRRTGFLPGHAQLAEALVYYFLGDLETAFPTLEEGKKWLRERGYKLPSATSNTEVQVIRSAVMEPGAFRDPNFKRQAHMLSQEDLETSWRLAPTAENRRALGIYLIRNGEPERGRGLILEGEASAPEAAASGRISNEDLCLVLEADRALGDPGTAQYLIGALAQGEDPLPEDTQVWALAGFICIDHGDLAAGRLAMERASALDPGNFGLKQQLERLNHKEGME
jgi:tetratricopeptide (TPR) repeat protein